MTAQDIIKKYNERNSSSSTNASSYNARSIIENYYNTHGRYNDSFDEPLKKQKKKVKQIDSLDSIVQKRDKLQEELKKKDKWEGTKAGFITKLSDREEDYNPHWLGLRDRTLALNEVIKKEQEKRALEKKQTTVDKMNSTIVGGVKTAEKGITRTIEQLQTLGGKNPLIDKNKYDRFNKNLNESSFEERLSQEAINQTDNKLGKFGLQMLGSVSQIVPQIAVGNSFGALATAFANYGGSAYNQARREGKTNEQALKYGLATGTLETTLQKTLGGLSSVYGKSVLGSVTSNVTKNLIKNKPIRDYLVSMGSEGLEEYVQDILNPVVRNATMGETNKFEPLSKQALESAIMGSLTAGILNAKVPISQSMKKTIDSNVINTNVNSQQNIQSKDNQINSKNITVDIQNNIPFETADKIGKITAINPIKYIPSENPKIDNLRKSANNNLTDGKKTQDFIKVAEKIIEDKNYNIIFDDSLKSSVGNEVNARIKKLANGEKEIRINPNSKMAGEFLLVHEITHDIETNEMKNLVMDYASKNHDFNENLKSLQQTYNTEDVTDEVLADVSGQLFGNQEFINNLSMEKPNIFKKIYNQIISLANKITGNSKEALFIKDLKNKWEKAYRAGNNNLNDTKYMMTSIKGMKNGINVNNKYQDIKNRYKNALELESNNVNNENIRQKTGWFKNKYGDWEFEISDVNTKFKIQPKANTKYKLSKIFEASTLYDMYPSLKDVDVIFKNTKSLGNFFEIKNTITINNLLLNDLERAKGTLLHEIQHYIQVEENLPKGTTILFGNEQYADSLGEIEAAVTKNRRDLTSSQRRNIIPESAKQHPIHPNREAILNHKRNNIEKVAEKLYNIYGDKSEISKENFIKDNGKTSRSATKIFSKADGLKGLENSSFSFSDKKIKHSQKSDKWHEHLEKNYKATGTRTPMVDIKQNIKYKDPTKESSYDNEGLLTPENNDATYSNVIISSLDNNVYKLNNLKNIKRVTVPTTDFYRNMRNIFNKESADKITGSFDKAKLNNVKMANALADDLKLNIVDRFNIRKKSKDSTLVQKYGEKIITEEELKELSPNWKGIIEADKYFRNRYDQLIDKINSVRKTIYPFVEETINETNSKIEELNKQLKDNNNKLNLLSRDSKEYLEINNKIKKITLEKQNLNNLLESDDILRNKRIKKRKDYYRHFNEMSEGFKALRNIANANNDIPAQLVGISDFTKPNTKFSSIAQTRFGEKTKYDAVGGYLEYINIASFMINIDPQIYKLRKLTNDMQIQMKDSTSLNTAINFLSKYTDMLAGKTNYIDRPVMDSGKKGRTTMKYLNWFNNRIKANMILGNVSSSISQVLNLPQIIGEIKNPKFLIEGFVDTYKRKDYSKSQFITERYKSDYKKQFDTKIYQKPKKMALWMINALDEVVTKAGWNALYKKAVGKGISNPIQYADNNIRDLVAGRGIGEKTLAQESKIVNMLVPFTVEVGNQIRVIKDFKHKKDFAGLLIMFIASYIINKAMKKIGAGGSSFDPIGAIEDVLTEEDINALEAIGRLSGEILSNIPVGQQMAALYPEWGGQYLPTRKQLFGDKDPTRFGTGGVLPTALENIPTRVATPWGGKQIEKSIKGFNMIKKGGEYDKKGNLKYPVDQNFINTVRALSLGNTKETSDYYSNKRRPLSSNQTELIKKGVKTYNDILKEREEKRNKRKERD